MSDTDFEPVVTLEDLDSLDDDDIGEGYRAGRAGDPEPGHNRGRAYWHGWRNGMVDGKHMEKDAAMATLAHLYLARERARSNHPQLGDE